MKEIKFRAWDIDEWLYFTLRDLIVGNARHNLRLKNWCQYAGKKDKNGKEIYKGDILETNGIDGKQLWEVVYELSSAVMGFHCECISGGFSSVHNEVWEKGKIIGSIFVKILGKGKKK